jgi:hypothetical protein
MIWACPAPVSAASRHGPASHQALRRLRLGQGPAGLDPREACGTQALDGGSLYWVIRGEVMCRQRLLGIEPFVDRGGIGRCRLLLEPKLTLVEPRLWRAFQGWRYLAAKDAPRDLDRVAPGAKDMPETLRRELRELGLL